MKSYTAKFEYVRTALALLVVLFVFFALNGALCVSAAEVGVMPVALADDFQMVAVEPVMPLVFETRPVETEPAPTEPPATEPPATEPPATEPPATEPPATEPPATEPPATEPPATEPPATEPPATEPPATEPPATEPPATEPAPTVPEATEPEERDVYDLSTYTMGDMALQLLDEINQHRAEAGLAPVQIDTKLSAMATVRSYEASIKWSHTRPDGRRSFSIYTDYDYDYAYAGENLLYSNYKCSATRMANNWMNSDGHRAVMLSANYTTVGLGFYYVNNRVYATALFVG